MPQDTPVVAIDASLCAHTRKGQIGCTRCQDACPSSALKTGGNAIELDAIACDGHGTCTTVCPTGAIRFIAPVGDGVFVRLRALLLADAIATAPVLVIHDADGACVFEALAEAGTALPDGVLTLNVQKPSEAGLDLMLAAIAYGASQVRILTGPEHRDSLPGLKHAAAVANAIMDGLGHRGDWVTIDDGSVLDEYAAALGTPTAPHPVTAANFAALGTKRQILSLALDHLAAVSPAITAPIALPDGAPFGAYAVDGEKCTLCYSCITACPTQALSGTPSRLLIAFQESNCVQCGLCRNLCPESAITLTPQLSLAEDATSFQVMYRDDAFECVKCGAPFASKSAIEHMTKKLAAHPMFQEPGKMDMLKMCDTCRSQGQM